MSLIVKVCDIVKEPIADEVNVLKALASAPWTPVLRFIASSYDFAVFTVVAWRSELKAVENALKPLIFTSAAAIGAEEKSVLATLSLVRVVTPVAPLRPKR